MPYLYPILLNFLSHGFYLDFENLTLKDGTPAMLSKITIYKMLSSMRYVKKFCLKNLLNITFVTIFNASNYFYELGVPETL